jgi:hypothetical protein
MFSSPNIPINKHFKNTTQHTPDQMAGLSYSTMIIHRSHCIESRSILPPYIALLYQITALAQLFFSDNSIYWLGLHVLLSEDLWLARALTWSCEETFNLLIQSLIHWELSHRNNPIIPHEGEPMCVRINLTYVFYFVVGLCCSALYHLFGVGKGPEIFANGGAA